MAKKDPETTKAILEEAGRAAQRQKYVLRLHVAGMMPRSREAIRAVTAIREEHLADPYELEVIDLYQHPTVAKGEQMIATPTLIKKLPEPLRRFIGSMADTKKILAGLDPRPKENKRK